MLTPEPAVEEGQVASAEPMPRRRLFKNRMLVFGLGLAILWILLAVLAPVIAPYGPNAVDMAVRLAPPSWQHLMGTLPRERIHEALEERGVEVLLELYC